MTAFGPARRTGTQDAPAPRGGTIQSTPSLLTLTALHMERTMDFWNWLWVLAFPAILITAWIMITNAGRQALSQYRTEKDEPAVVVPKKKTNEQAEWQKQFLELKQQTCTKHEYDRDRMHDWWKCIHCEAEEEWTYSGGCACFVVYDGTVADHHLVLTERNRFCTIHGRGPAVRAIQNFEKYSKGGITS